MSNDEHLLPPHTPNLPTAEMPTRVTPQEIFRQIDLVRQGISFESPQHLSLLQFILNSDYRRRIHLLEEAKAGAIKARKETIDGLTNAIKIYIDTHKADLRVRGQAFVQTTFTQLSNNLFATSQSAVISFFTIYSQQIDRIMAIKNLTDEQKDMLIRRAFESAQEMDTYTRQTFYSILDSISDQVKKMINEMGQ